MRVAHEDAGRGGGAGMQTPWSGRVPRGQGALAPAGGPPAAAGVGVATLGTTTRRGSCAVSAPMARSTAATAAARTSGGMRGVYSAPVAVPLLDSTGGAE